MIKSNSKKARERIRSYIIDGFHDSDYETWNGLKVDDFSIIAKIILTDFNRVTGSDYYYRRFPSNMERFVDFTRGLPSMVNCDFWLGCEAGKDLLAAWLEETETEKNKYTEEKACVMIARMIYRELSAAAGLVGDNLETLTETLKRGERL